MKQIYSILILAVIALSFISCRKGEDDPLISFRSRNNRLEGEWKLKSSNVYWYSSYISSNIYHDTTSHGGSQESTFDGSQLYNKNVTIDVQRSTGTNIHDTVTIETWNDYSYTLKINGDGTFEINQYKKETAYKRTHNGTSVTTDPSGALPTTSNTQYTGNWQWEDSDKRKISVTINGSTYEITELRNKVLSLRLKVNPTSSSSFTTYGNTISTSQSLSDWHFEQD